MKFTISRNLQGKHMAGMPVTIEVGPPEDRKDYRCPASCATVYPVSIDSYRELIERKLVLGSQRVDRVFVCDCLGSRERALRLTRPLLILDLEGTSLDVAESRIVEFACTVLNPDGTRKQFSQRFNPGIPIPLSATEVHGISNADVAGCPYFREYAAKIQKGLEGKDIGGYNLRGYDLPVLENEYARAGLKFTVSGSAIVDVFGLYQKLDPRDLSAAVRKYCGREHDGAHGAQADCDATLAVLEGQIAKHTELAGMSVADLAKFSVRGDIEPVDLAGKIGRNADGALVYLFGKHRGETVESQPGFASWVLSKDFAESTKDVLRAELDRLNL
jgi:DNA polymerase III subunit epsilon